MSEDFKERSVVIAKKGAGQHVHRRHQRHTPPSSGPKNGKYYLHYHTGLRLISAALGEILPQLGTTSNGMIECEKKRLHIIRTTFRQNKKALFVEGFIAST
jgi:hypothetical protein